MGGMAWWWLSAVGSNNNTHLLLSSLFTLAQPHHHETADGWWHLFIRVFSSSPYSIYVVHTFLQMLFVLVKLTDDSLYSSTVYILTHNVLLASPGRAQKSKQNHNKLLRCSLHDFLISPLFLTHIFTSTHSLTSRYLLSCMANQIPWYTHKANHKGPNRIKI